MTKTSKEYSKMGKQNGGPDGGTCPLCKKGYPHSLGKHLPKCPER